MTYEQLIDKINEKINTNGEGEITGAVLNEVLNDIVATLKNDADTVHVLISGNQPIATFVWPFEDTEIENLVIDGYDITTFVAEHKFPIDGMKFGDSTRSRTYTNGRWRGTLQSLTKGGWYYIQYDNADNANYSIYIRPNQ